MTPVNKHTENDGGAAHLGSQDSKAARSPSTGARSSQVDSFPSLGPKTCIP